MLAMARPCSTASTPCTPRFNSSLSILKRPTCSLSPISPKLNFLAEREIHITRNRIAAKASKKSYKKLVQPPGNKDDYIQRYEEIRKLSPEIIKKTWFPKVADYENVKKTWYIIDATDQRLGKLASTIALLTNALEGRVIVVNAENVAVSETVYKRYSGRPSGLKEETFDNLQRSIPERIIEDAVRGMLSKGRLGRRRLFTHLNFYKGPNHPQEAQKPVPLPIMDERIMIEK